MSKSERVKPEINMVKMNNLGEVNQAMRRIRDMKAAMTRMDLEAQGKIDVIKNQVAKKAKPLIEKLESLENGILAYAEYDKDNLFKKIKTLELTFGFIGFRKSTKIRVKQTTVQKLKEHGFKNAIIVKESPNKEILSQWGDDKLKIVDAKRITEDNFWYEVKEEGISKKVKTENK